MRLRRPDDLQSDPRYPYMVGRLVGSSEMLARYLEYYGDERGKAMAAWAHRTIDFFLEEEHGKGSKKQKDPPVGGWEYEAGSADP